MAEITLVAEPNRATGTRESRRLRAAGRIPGVVYGHGTEGISVSVDGRELRHALSGESGANQLLELEIGSERHLAMARDLQRHPVRHTVLHVDFQLVRRDEVISADVPLVLVGEAKSVDREGGLVEQQLTALAVQATPGRIPSSIEVDISALTVGERIRVEDVRLPSGVTTEVGADEVVVTASLSRGAGEGAADEAGQEGAGRSGAETAGAESTGGAGSEEG